MAQLITDVHMPGMTGESLLDNEMIRHAGLSQVSVKDIEAASEEFKVATVQNRYNLVDRDSEDVVTYCEKHGIGFIGAVNQLLLGLCIFHVSLDRQLAQRIE